MLETTSKVEVMEAARVEVMAEVRADVVKAARMEVMAEVSMGEVMV